MNNQWIGYARKAGLKKEYVGPFSSYEEADNWLKYYAQFDRFVELGINVIVPLEDFWKG